MTDEVTARVFDPGLQPERTALAWQRTVLALTVALLGGSRLLLPIIGNLAYLVAGLCLSAGGVLLVVTDHRYRRMHRHLTAKSLSPQSLSENQVAVNPGGANPASAIAAALPTGGSLVTLCAVACLACGLVALGFVLTRG